MDIFNKIKGVDKGAFDKFFREHYEPLCHYANKFIFDLHQCEDIVQNVFVRIWNNRRRIIVTTSLKSFVYQSVRNSCIDYIRKQLNIKHVDIESIEEKEFEITEPVTLELIEGVKEAIKNLPVKCQTIFRMSKEAGLSYKEIAEELDVSVKTVENQVGIALKKIRLYLREHNLNTILWILGV